MLVLAKKYPWNTQRLSGTATSVKGFPIPDARLLPWHKRCRRGDRPDYRTRSSPPPHRTSPPFLWRLPKKTNKQKRFDGIKKNVQEENCKPAIGYGSPRKTHHNAPAFPHRSRHLGNKRQYIHLITFIINLCARYEFTLVTNNCNSSYSKLFDSNHLFTI